MAHEIHASIVLRLEDDQPKEWISALSVVAAEWTKFLASVEPLQGIAAFNVSESGKAAGANGVKRRRRRRNTEGKLVDPTEAEQLAAVS